MSSFSERFFPPLPSRDPDTATKLILLLRMLPMLVAAFAGLYIFRVEEASGLTQLLPYLAAGILINLLLPHRFRSAFFALAGMAGIVYALGPLSGGILIATIFLLIGICHLPAPYYLRVFLLLAVTTGAAALRLQVFYVPRLIVITPLLGTLLMFRLILYMHEIRFEKKSPTIAQRLSYFFNPVNIAFPLFPILDYKTWLRQHVDEDLDVIFRQAIRRILLGTLHLLLYRWLYQHVPNAATLQTAGDLLLFILGGYALILRMTGIFWIAVGLLGLFGYRLPPVFDNVFLVTSFGEIWRKINIYWRDFVTKVFYYPIYFRLRKKVKAAVLVTAMIVFVVTWLLHGWQWFWLRGDFSFRATDTLYWMALGVCIAITLAIESRDDYRPKKSATASWGNSFRFMLRVTGMYLFMSVLWTLWNSASLHEWFYLLSLFSHQSATALPLAGIVVAVILAGTAVHFFITNKTITLPDVASPRVVIVMTMIVALFSISVWPPVRNHLPPFARKVLADIHRFKLNQQDRDNAEQGYYEKLVDARGSSPWGVSLTARNKTKWFTAAEIPVNDMRMRALQPSMVLKSDSLTFSVNEWGMRSAEHPTKDKPAHTIRIAILGGSYEMGSGVDDAAVFATRLEEKFNAYLKGRSDSTRVQVLNFSAGAYHLPQYAWLCDHTVFDFHPDIVLSFAHSLEAQRLNGVIARMVQNGVSIDYPEIKNIVQKSGAAQTMSRTEVRNRLQPWNDSLLDWGYRHVAQACAQHHAQVVWVYLPALADNPEPSEVKTLATHALNAGMDTLSLTNVYGKNRNNLWVNPDDSHPNAEGHRLISDALYLKILSSTAWKNINTE